MASSALANDTRLARMQTVARPRIAGRMVPCPLIKLDEVGCIVKLYRQSDLLHAVKNTGWAENADFSAVGGSWAVQMGLRGQAASRGVLLGKCFGRLGKAAGGPLACLAEDSTGI